jgi:hypothetical protein
MDWTKYLGFSVGGGVVTFGLILGFIKWSGNTLRTWLFSKHDAKSRQALELYKVKLSSSTFVTRAHFETEYDAYKKIFAGLGEVSLTFTGLRPSMDMAPANETKEEKRIRFEKRLNLLSAAHDHAVKIVEHMRPFYPSEIFIKASISLAIARGEMMDFATDEHALSVTGFQAGRNRLKEFNLAYESAIDAVRTRIATLAIIPDPPEV